MAIAQAEKGASSKVDASSPQQAPTAESWSGELAAPNRDRGSLFKIAAAATMIGGLFSPGESSAREIPSGRPGAIGASVGALLTTGLQVPPVAPQPTVDKKIEQVPGVKFVSQDGTTEITASTTKERITSLKPHLRAEVAKAIAAEFGVRPGQEGNFALEVVNRAGDAVVARGSLQGVFSKPSSLGDVASAAVEALGNRDYLVNTKAGEKTITVALPGHYFRVVPAGNDDDLLADAPKQAGAQTPQQAGPQMARQPVVTKRPTVIDGVYVLSENGKANTRPQNWQGINLHAFGGGSLGVALMQQSGIAPGRAAILDVEFPDGTKKSAPLGPIVWEQRALEANEGVRLLRSLPVNVTNFGGNRPGVVEVPAGIKITVRPPAGQPK